MASQNTQLVARQWDPVDPAWGTCKGVQHLQYMALVSPVPPPYDMQAQMDFDVTKYLELMRKYTKYDVMEPEQIDDRVDIWNLDKEDTENGGDPPSWFYLRDQDMHKHKMMHGWAPLVK